VADQPVDDVEAYLRRMAEIRSTGGATSETSYYSALENLLNAVGRTLKPHVVATNIMRRLTALVILTTELDANYHAIRGASFDWSSVAANA